MDADAQDPKLRALLQQYYGYDTFRPGQYELVSAVVGAAGVAPRDALGIMATGHGKSVCFQLPALHTGRVVVCVSPLISLMQDQVAKLNESVGRVWAKAHPGESHEVAVFLGSAQRSAAAESQAASGAHLFVYMSPEKLVTSGLGLLQQLHASGRLCCIAIDEAHCVSEWGTDFRPDYSRLREIRGVPALQHVPIIAVTATAPPAVRRDVTSVLQLDPGHASYVGDFYRRNLVFSTHAKGSFDSDFAPLLRGLKTAAQTGTAYDKPTIIYCISKKNVDDMQATLQARVDTDLDIAKRPAGSLVILRYHADMSLSAREEAHKAFLTGFAAGGARAPVIVATIAFGMGIDKPDVRQIIHYGPPKTLEAYYQQAGRAGRDGQPAKCTLFYNSTEFAKYKDDFWAPKLPDGKINLKQKAIQDQSLEALRQYAVQGMDMDTMSCRQTNLVTYLVERESRTVIERFPAWCRCDCCMKGRGEEVPGGGLFATKQMDFSLELRAILGVAELYREKARGAFMDILLGLNRNALSKKGVALTLRLRGGDAAFGAFKATAYPTREVLKDLIEVAVTKKLLCVRTVSFRPPPPARSIAYEAIDITPAGQALLQRLEHKEPDEAPTQTPPRPAPTQLPPNKPVPFDPSAPLKPVPFTPQPMVGLVGPANPPPAPPAAPSGVPREVMLFPPQSVANVIAAAEAKRAKARSALKDLEGVIDADAVPAAEMEEGDGPVMRAMLQWGRYMKRQRDRCDAPDLTDEQRGHAKKRVADGERLLEALTAWREAEAVRLTLAPATVLAEDTLKRLAYAVACGANLTPLFIDEIGVRTGDVGKLLDALQAWQGSAVGASRKRTAGDMDGGEDGGSESAADAYILPPLSVWDYTSLGAVPGAPKLSATVLESVCLFVEGNSFDAVGVKRPKQITAQTVQKHILDAFLNGFRGLVGSRSAIERLAVLFPRPSEVVAIEAAAAELGFDLDDPKARVAPLKERLGEDNEWYNRIRMYQVMRKLRFPFHDERSKRGTEPAAKRVRTS